MELLKVYDFLRNPEVMAFAGLTLCQVTWWLLVYQGHEKAHQKEAEKYHELKNPVITDDHFDCDNWEDFSETEIKKVAWAGIIFDLQINFWNAGRLSQKAEPEVEVPHKIK